MSTYYTGAETWTAEGRVEFHCQDYYPPVVLTEKYYKIGIELFTEGATVGVEQSEDSWYGDVNFAIESTKKALGIDEVPEDELNLTVFFEVLRSVAHDGQVHKIFKDKAKAIE